MRKFWLVFMTLVVQVLAFAAVTGCGGGDDDDDSSSGDDDMADDDSTGDDDSADDDSDDDDDDDDADDDDDMDDDMDDDSDDDDDDDTLPGDEAFSVDFEDDTVGDDPGSPWTVVEDGDAEAEVVDLDAKAAGGNGVQLTSGDAISFAFIDTEITYSDTPEMIYVRLDGSIFFDGGAFVDFAKIDDAKSSEPTIPVYNFGLSEGDPSPSVWDGITATFCEAISSGVFFQLDVILDMINGTSTTKVNGVTCAEDIDLQNNEVPDLFNLYVGGEGGEFKVDNIRINYQF